MPFLIEQSKNMKLPMGQKYGSSGVSLSNPLPRWIKSAAFQLKIYYVPGVGQTALHTLVPLLLQQLYGVILPILEMRKRRADSIHTASNC